MKTEKFKYLGYFETTGGPVCITNSCNLPKWTGSEHETGSYWDMVETTDNKEILTQYDDDFLIFNTDTGNFLLFESNEKIIIVEAIYLEEDFSIDFSGVVFDIKEEINLSIQLTGMTIFFDSTLTIHDQFKKETICKSTNSDFLILLQ